MDAQTAFLESSRYAKPGLRGAHAYLLPSLLGLCRDLAPGSRVLDIGCGNGAVASEFLKRGHKVVGIDLAESGIRVARESCGGGRFELLAANSSVLENLNEQPFDLVYSLEVVEHLYDPRSFMAGCFAATRPQGKFICSTPYHGYWKNLAISVANGWDKHADPLFDGGHIKFFSRKTFSALLAEAGFRDVEFHASGRLPYLWKSMIFTATRP